MRLKPIALATVMGMLAGAACVWWIYPRVHRAPEDHALRRLRAIDAQARHSKFDAVILGDSITEYSPVTELCGQSVFNAGVAGARAADIVIVADRLLRIMHPRRVWIAVGTNDAVRTADTSDAAFRQSYADLVRLAKASGAQVMAVGLSPIAKNMQKKTGLFDLDRRQSLERIIRTSDATYISLQPMGKDDGYLPATETVDGIHLNQAGYSNWQAALRAACPPT